MTPMRTVKRLTAATTAAVVLFLTAGCTEQFTFEAHPSGEGDADTFQGDPRDVRCFTIEADSSGGDDKDRQLGEFCKVAVLSDAAREDVEQEQDDDD